MDNRLNLNSVNCPSMKILWNAVSASRLKPAAVLVFASIPFRSFLDSTGPVFFWKGAEVSERTEYQPVKTGFYWLILFPYRYNRIMTGIWGSKNRYSPSHIPVLFSGIWPLSFRAVPFCSVTGPLPVRSVPILLHCNVQQKPPQVTSLQQPKGKALGLRYFDIAITKQQIGAAFLLQ